MRRASRWLVVVLLAVGLVAAGCGLQDRDRAVGGLTACGGPAADCRSGHAACVGDSSVCIPVIELREGRARIDGVEKFLAGIVYHPVPPCAEGNYDFTAQPSLWRRDLPNLQALGGNPESITVLRLVRPPQPAFLDAVWHQGMMVIAGHEIDSASDFTRPETCAAIKRQFRQEVEANQGHPAIFAYELGSEIALEIVLSKRPDTEAQLRAWYRCVNEAAAIVAEVEVGYARPVATVSEASDDDPIGSPEFGAADASLSNLGLHMVSIYRNTTVREWLFGAQKARTSKPVFVSGYGADACAFDGVSCRVDEQSQARYVVTLARDLGAAYHDERPDRRAIGGAGFEYTDEWWKAKGDLCTQGPGGYREGAYEDRFLNEEWMGLLRLDGPTGVVPRPAYRGLRDTWTGARPWAAAPRREVQIRSHATGAEVAHVGYLWGTFAGFLGSEDVVLLIAPDDGTGLYYPQPPLSLHYASGPEEWAALVYFGEGPGQNRGMKFKVIPAYSTAPSGYETLTEIIAGDRGLTLQQIPPWITMLPERAVVLTRR